MLFRSLIKRLAQPEPSVFIASALTGLSAIFGEDEWLGTLPQDSILVETALPLLTSGEVMITDHSGDALLLRPFTHPYRLMIVGAVHIAQPLAEMARLTGFEVMVIDPRQGYATTERFSNIELLIEWPDTALTRLKPNARTAIVTLSHDVKLDDPALQACLATSAFYIGALGSRRNHAKRLERLADQGFNEKSLARIQAPVGLDLGGNSPGEIALDRKSVV